MGLQGVQSTKYCLCINVALCSTALQCICRVIRRSSMTMKARIYYIIFGRPPIGGKLPPLGGATASTPVAHSEIMKRKTAWQARERLRMRQSHINIINIGLHIKLQITCTINGNTLRSTFNRSKSQNIIKADVLAVAFMISGFYTLLIKRLRVLYSCH